MTQDSEILTGIEKASERIAVIVVSYNSGATLTRCLESIHRQTLFPHRVIIIDNASVDGSAVAAAKAYPEFTFKFLAENTGFAAANNCAARMADDCDWLALLNPDAYAAADWLEKLSAATRCNPEFAFFGSRMLMAKDPARIDGTGDVYHASGLVWRGGYRNIAFNHAVTPKEIFSPCAAAALYRRNEFLEVSGFDESFFCYMEDVDLGFRLRLRGLRCLYVPDAIVHHEGSASTAGQHSDFAVYHGHRNLVWVFVKDMPGLLFCLLLPLHVLLNLVTVAWFTMHGQGRIILRAKRDAMRGLSSAWAKRRQVQKGRLLSISGTWRLLNKDSLLFKSNSY